MKSTFSIVVMASVSAFLAASPAIAQPTYLACTLMIDGQPERIDFTTDEQAGTVSILITSSGSSRTVNGTFTPDRVVVDEPSARWAISRVNLEFSRTVKMIDATDVGQCEVQEAPRRIF